MTRPVLECCTPYGVPLPSGWGWAHSRKCPLHPGQKVGSERPRRADLEAAVEDHPASGDKRVVHWDENPEHDPASCDVCGYVDAHADDEDDPVVLSLVPGLEREEYGE